MDFECQFSHMLAGGQNTVFRLISSFRSSSSLKQIRREKIFRCLLYNKGNNSFFKLMFNGQQPLRFEEEIPRPVVSQGKFTRPKIIFLDRLHFPSIIVNNFTRNPDIVGGQK